MAHAGPGVAAGRPMHVPTRKATRMSDPATRLDQIRPERQGLAPRTGIGIDRSRAAIAAARRLEKAETEAFIQRMRAIVESRSESPAQDRTEHGPPNGFRDE